MWLHLLFFRMGFNVDLVRPSSGACKKPVLILLLLFFNLTFEFYRIPELRTRPLCCDIYIVSSSPFFFSLQRDTHDRNIQFYYYYFFFVLRFVGQLEHFSFFFSSLPRRSIQYCGLFYWSITWSRFYACQIVQVDFRRTEWHSNILFIFPSLVCLFSFFFIYLRCVQPTQSQMLPWIIIPSLFCLTPSIPRRLLRGKFKEEEEKKS